MKRLMRSSRFWATVLGTMAANYSYKLTDDGTFALAILGAFTAIVVTGASKDIVRTWKGENG